MKTLLYTQRVEIIEDYGERRDCADQMIGRFLLECGYLPLPIPNIPGIVRYYVNEYSPAGIFISGGNSLSKYGGDAPERDETERVLIEVALENKVPVLGICRGMQLILDYFNTTLTYVDGHVGKEHMVSGPGGKHIVNSFHKMGAYVNDVVEPLEVYEKSEDGIAEMIRHKDKPIMAIMWHPERYLPFRTEDLELVKNFFGGRSFS